jgi:DNA primase
VIPQSFIQDLLNRLDIVDVVGRYVPLKKAGANYSACCPFHNEKSPSFTVSPAKQFYHCFGCGAHGTAIGFVMEYAGMGFVEAVEDLAKEAGMQVPREERPDARPRQGGDLTEVMQRAARYYIDQLKQSPRAIDYLKRRGLSGEVAKRFGIGYAPEGWQNLAAVFPFDTLTAGSGDGDVAPLVQYASKALAETGMVIESDAGKRYDRFRDRIMFPILNARGQIIGFGGRVLDKGEPKYLNSPETSLFEKGRELYGLFQAQKSIRNEGMALVVEGYMDVVALAQHGIEYAVATLGTATTPYHVQKLLRMTDTVVFCFDGDAAGRRAAWRALENALPQLLDGKQLRFLFLPPEHDPDSYVREHGKEAFEHLLGDESLPLSGYMLRELSAQVDLKTQEGRSALLERAKPLLLAIAAPTTALLLRKEIAALAGISQAELEALYGVKSLGDARPSAPRRATPQKAARPAPSGLRALLRCILARPDLARDYPSDQVGDDVYGTAIAAVLANLREHDFDVSSAALIQQFQGTQHEKVLAEAEAEIMQWGENFDVEAEYRGIVERLQQAMRKQRFEELNRRVGEVGLARLGQEERELYLMLLKRQT